MICGSEICQRRKKLGLTQEYVSKRVGISQAHLAKIENGRVDARLSTINKILNVLDESGVAINVESVMSKNVFFVSPDSPVQQAVSLMKLKDLSQLPVVNDCGVVVGSIRERDIIKNLNLDFKNTMVEEVMGEPLPIITKSHSLDSIKKLVVEDGGVLVSDKGVIKGIITKYDLLRLK